MEISVEMRGTKGFQERRERGLVERRGKIGVGGRAEGGGVEECRGREGGRGEKRCARGEKGKGWRREERSCVVCDENHIVCSGQNE